MGEALSELNSLFDFLEENYTIDDRKVKESELNSTKSAIESI